MPLYEYRCTECEHLEEVLQKVSDPAPATCPSCGRKQTMAKEVSLTSFQLKGGGWYKDLYSSPSTAKGDAGEKKGTEAAKPSTSESKPASSGDKKAAAA